MLYQLLNRWFGWDYITWGNAIDHGIARVMIDAEGRPFYWQYRATKLPKRIADPAQHIWLTCSPAKYLATNCTEGKS